MAKTKVTAEKFDAIKSQLITMSKSDVARSNHLSPRTVGLISSADTYEEYREEVSEANRIRSDRLLQVNFFSMTDEERYWKIHTDLLWVSNEKIKEKTGLSIDIIRLIKHTLDYEDYLSRKNDKQKIRKRRRYVNDGVYEIAKQGFKQGLTETEVAKTLDLSITTISRICRSRTCSEMDGRNSEGMFCNLMSKRTFEHFCDIYPQCPQRYRPSIKRCLEKGYDYYDWSVIYYLNKNPEDIYWRKKTVKKPIKTLEEPIKFQEQSDFKNQVVFDWIKKGQNLKYSVETISRDLHCDKEFVQEIFDTCLWKEYRKKHNISDKIYPAIDEELFIKIRKCIDNNLDPMDFIYQADKYQSEIENMSEYKDFEEYLIGTYFKEKPIWLKEPSQEQDISLKSQRESEQDVFLELQRELNKEIRKCTILMEILGVLTVIILGILVISRM